MAKSPRMLIAGIITASVLSPATRGEENSDQDLSRVESLKRHLIEQQSQLQQQERALQAQRRQLEALRIELDGLTRGRGVTTGGGGAETGETTSAERETVGQAPEVAEEQRPPEVARISDEVGGVLTPRGKLVVEPSLEYVYSSSNRVALEGFTIVPAVAIGNIDIREVDRETFIGTLTLRYGLTNRLETEFKVPYVYRDDDVRTRPIGVSAVEDEVFNADGDGLGDIEFLARYQMNRGLGGWPFFVGNLRVKSRTGEDPFEVNIDADTGLPTELATGSGFWAVEPSVTALFPSDPAVFFGNVRYIWNIERDVGGGFGDIDPGDGIGFSFGLGFGINERASMSVGYEHTIVGKTEQEGNKITGSDTAIGNLLIGYSYRLTDATAVNLNLAVGATEDAPDVRLTLRIPFMFGLF